MRFVRLYLMFLENKKIQFKECAINFVTSDATFFWCICCFGCLRILTIDKGWETVQYWQLSVER
jgi:hypothetical protein